MFPHNSVFPINCGMQSADRLQTVHEYYFSVKLREIAALRAQGKSVINLGIGSPDLPPPPEAVEVLVREAQRADAHQYQSYQGIPEFRNAIAGFYKAQFGVDLAPAGELLPLMGSKEGITHISLAYLNRGDQVLIPALGYPTYTSVTQMVEAEPLYYPLREDRQWEPDWDFFENLDFSKIKILWLNYPHMPTGTVGSLALLERFVQLAQKHSLLLVHDNPYSFILNERPTSIFEVPGAKNVCLELNSLSKTFNMSGWRVGWAAGSEALLQPVLRIKSNMDSGMFRPVQLAAATALTQGTHWYSQLAHVYRERRERAFELLDRLDCTYSREQSGLFVWARSPLDDVSPLIDQWLYEKSLFITPGHIFGEAGRPYVRISLCSPVAVFEEAIGRI